VKAVKALQAGFHSSIHVVVEIQREKLRKISLNHNIIIQEDNLHKQNHKDTLTLFGQKWALQHVPIENAPIEKAPKEIGNKMYQ
jgi:hypothetical protein